MPADKILTASEAAAFLNITVADVARLSHGGRLIKIRSGRHKGYRQRALLSIIREERTRERDRQRAVHRRRGPTLATVTGA